jgi:uncharacterized protein (TIGR00369 family)
VTPAPAHDLPEGFRLLRLPASGFLEANGPFHARWDGLRFVLGLRIEARHCNAGGVCHGGMLATLCDMLLTIGSNIQSGQSRFLPTVSINCDFLAPAPLGAWVEGRLEVLRVTRHLLFASGLLEVAGEGPIARTSGVMKIGGEVDARFASDRYFDPHPTDPTTDQLTD